MVGQREREIKQRKNFHVDGGHWGRNVELFEGRGRERMRERERERESCL